MASVEVICINATDEIDYTAQEIKALSTNMERVSFRFPHLILNSSEHFDQQLIGSEPNGNQKK